VPAHLFGYRATLLVAAGFVLIALLPIALVHEGPPDGAGKTLRQILTFHDKRKLLWLGLPEMLIGFGAGLTIPFFNVYFKNEWGLTPQQIAPIFMAMFGVLVVSYLVTPPLVRRFGPVKVMIVAQILSLPFFVELALGHYLWAAMAAFVARQVLMNNSDPIYKQFAQEVADDRDRNAVAVWVHSSRHIFFTVANFVSGYMIAMDDGHFRIVIVTTIICYVIAIGVELAVLPGLNRARRYKLVASSRGERVAQDPGGLA
jgi:predicted MFS family arabinose efflux permease